MAEVIRSLAAERPPPPPPPAPAPPRGAALLLATAQQAGGLGDRGGVRELLRRQKARFSRHLTWLLFLRPVPSLIQEGPQCGLVALWMAGAHLGLPSEVPLERIRQVALERGYTAQGEMFSGCHLGQALLCNGRSVLLVTPSAADMAKLAEEVFPCKTELLSGGLQGQNHARILQHLRAGFPVLIPYDEDYNHEPCLRNGYKAHWAVASGALLGLKSDFHMPAWQEDEDIPGLFHASHTASAIPLEAIAETYLLSKHGKSCRYQLWSYAQIQESNAQLMGFSPQRAADGKVYIVPAGGVREGLCGQAVLLRPMARRGSGGIKSALEEGCT